MIKSVTQMRGFLGLCKYYAQYVKDFAEIALPLSGQLQQKGQMTNEIIWKPEMYDSFNKLKLALLQNVVLDIADPSKPYVLEVDASDYAGGGVLQQEDSEERIRPVAVFSRKLFGSPKKATSRMVSARKGDLRNCAHLAEIPKLASKHIGTS